MVLSDFHFQFFFILTPNYKANAVLMKTRQLVFYVCQVCFSASLSLSLSSCPSLTFDMSVLSHLCRITLSVFFIFLKSKHLVQSVTVPPPPPAALPPSLFLFVIITTKAASAVVGLI